jgi:hypothetical protein
MNFHEVVTLLRHNSNASDWNVVSENKASIGYCLEDVNLRLALDVIQDRGKTHFRIQIFYAATTLLSFTVPNVAGKTRSSRFTSAIDLTQRKLASLS